VLGEAVPSGPACLRQRLRCSVSCASPRGLRQLAGSSGRFSGRRGRHAGAHLSAAVHAVETSDRPAAPSRAHSVSAIGRQKALYRRASRSVRRRGASGRAPTPAPHPGREQHGRRDCREAEVECASHRVRRGFSFRKSHEMDRRAVRHFDFAECRSSGAPRVSVSRSTLTMHIRGVPRNIGTVCRNG
jgi:hypothetical protein